jgi:hypothetical protein
MSVYIEKIGIKIKKIYPFGYSIFEIRIQFLFGVRILKFDFCEIKLEKIE